MDLVISSRDRRKSVQVSNEKEGNTNAHFTCSNLFYQLSSHQTHIFVYAPSFQFSRIYLSGRQIIEGQTINDPSWPPCEKRTKPKTWLMMRNGQSTYFAATFLSCAVDSSNTNAFNSNIVNLNANESTVSWCKNWIQKIRYLPHVVAS